MKVCLMNNKTVLKNGVKIITESLDYAKSVSLGIWINTGSRFEQKTENGISHFIEHMIFKGTPNRDCLQIAREFDNIGGLANAFTGKEYTCFYSRVLDKHFESLGNILSDIFLNSIFDQNDINRESKVILQEINMVEDSPDEYVHDLFNNVFWGNNSLGMPVLGTGDTVSGLNREIILNYKNEFYTPERIIIAAAGNIDHEKVVAFFKPLLEPLEAVENNVLVENPCPNYDVLCRNKELEQVHLCLGARAPDLLSEKRFASIVFNTILGGNMSSRLFQEIREKHGLAYSIYSFISSFIDTAFLGVSAATDAEDINNVLRLINTEIKKIQNGELSEIDLNAVKEHLIGNILLGSESIDSRMMRMAKYEYLFDRYVEYDEIVNRIERVTLDEVIDSANEIFNTGRISLATVGPVEKKDLDISNLIFN